ncbi:hypothetical protein [Streptomyces corynorhini]|uniref:Uncharacterized protein n=1 Tax=Streptomyces corynorhini TaxID=2282652 RepID=A0A370B2E6_9ACTN|nr:hypothetical protein [Streptomyces corynorhini]RDG36047.1 hypothetical protein DVH02_21985 [Streptomyces corynorhini]
MNIDWAALGSVFGVSLVTTVALVGLFTLGVVALARPERQPDTGSGAPGGATGSVGALRTAGACLCFGLCLAAVAYGIHLIVA